MKRATKAAKAKRKTAGKATRKVSGGSSRAARKKPSRSKTVTKPAKKKTAKAVKKTGRKAAGKTAGKVSRKSTRKKVAGPAGRSSAAKRAGGAAKPGSDARKSHRPRPRGLKIGVGGPNSRAEQLRAILEAKRAEIIQEIRRTRQDSVKSDHASYAEVGDLVSASVEKERAFEYGEIGANLLREIDAALRKLKEGTFGICEMCTKLIGIRRLKVMPSARLCIKCKSKEEASGPGARGRSPSQED